MDRVLKKTLFNKYLVIQQIGKGSFGKIYKGINIKNGKKVAIKIVFFL
jgi:serine/threonine protein kinase